MSIQIDWQALQHEEGDVPWAAIQQAIDAIVESPERWEEFAQAYEDFQAEEEVHDFMGLYAIVILGEAGRRLPERAAAARDQIIEFLLDALVEAGNDGNEFGLTEIQYACGRIGPAILPRVLTHIARSEEGEEAEVMEMWGLLPLAADAPDGSMKEQAVALCIARMEEVLHGDLDVDALLEPMLVLAKIPTPEGREVMERVGREKKEEMVEDYSWPEFQEALAHVRGEARPAHAPEWWDREPLDLLTTELQFWKEWKDSAAEHDPAEAEFEDAEEMDEDDGLISGQNLALAEAFAQSEQASHLPEKFRADAEDRAQTLLEFGTRYFGPDAETWDIVTWRELLLDVLPRKIGCELPWFEALAPVAGALLRWMEAKGKSPNGSQLASKVESWGPEIMAAAGDPANWGIAKTILMEARAEGVDPGNDKALNDFIERYNARLDRESPAANDIAEQPADRWSPKVPYRRETEKVGRNDPCPCGSGKKYKKCCGR